MENQANLIATLGKMMTGLERHTKKGGLLVGGKSYTTSDVAALFQSIIDAVNASNAAHAAYLEASQKSASLIADNRSFIRDKYGSVTPDVKAAAAEKAKATRTARHTMGKKQKAKITGVSTPAAVVSSSAPIVIAPEPSAVPAAVSVVSSAGSGSSTPGTH